VVDVTRNKWRTLAWILLFSFIAIGTIAGVGWYKLLREESQPPFANPEMRFKYGSIGAEQDQGLPYWVFKVLPQVFPEYLPGPGGYASLGLAFEQGQDLPIGFSKKVVGFPRVANNCAVCHTASYRSSEAGTPTFIVGGPGHTPDVQAYFRFLLQSGKDPRFNPETLLRKIDSVTELSWLDHVFYRYLIIPIVKKRLIEQGERLAWIDRPAFPDWGRGRDDSLNLPKFVLLKFPVDDSFGPADFPSVWNLKKYQPGMALSWDGSATSVRTFVIDSAIGVGARIEPPFLDHVQWLQQYLAALPPPTYPFSVDQQLARSGESVFGQRCAACHGGSRTGTVIPIEEIATDRSRLDTWTNDAADGLNRAITAMGVEREGVIKTNGYAAPHLDGVWLRAPYLHNGSVPTLRDLLEPPDQRPRVFYRGYDVYDTDRVGFETQSEGAQLVGSKIDVSGRGNGNQGHLYGTDLSPQEKHALIEYLKTL
jgi:mono/diheme cytochrome c family protein